MSKMRNALARPSRRGVVKATGALIAGLAAPAILRVGSALAAYPERPVRIIVANTPGGPRLVGVVSAGPFPCGFGAPSIYARVASRLGFIRRAAGLP